MMRRVFKQLERPVIPDPCASDTWQHPDGHSTQYAYQFFTGGWGMWRYMCIDQSGRQQWVFVPFNDVQEQIGAVGRMKYTQHHQPQDAVTGSVWLCPNGSFKRVLSRGGAWENVNPGATHPDEVDHVEQQPGTEAQPGDDSAEVSGGSGESTPGDGSDGQVSVPTDDGVDGTKDANVIEKGADPDPEGVPEDTGVDGDTKDVL